MIEPIKIEVGSKYVLIVQPDKEDFSRGLGDTLRVVRDDLEKWVNSSDSFYVICLPNNIKVEFQKVDDGL